jgi:hypothetical protein
MAHNIGWASGGGTVAGGPWPGGTELARRAGFVGQGGRSSLGGRGINIGERLSSTWGVRADEGMLTVWAILPAPLNGRPSAPARHSGNLSSAYAQ